MPIALAAAQFFLDILNQAKRGIFDHVENKVEPMPQSVVRVWHFVVIEVAGVSHEQTDTILLFRASQTLQIVEVAFVHGQDQVEIIEILARHLAGTQLRQVVTPGRGSALGSRVGRLTDVITMRSCRSNSNSISEGIDFYKMSENTLSRR